MSIYPCLAKASLGLVLALGFVPPTLAQIVPNGAGTVVNPQGNQINIIGGTQAGGNLFHSFRDFNVNSAQVANFLSNPQIKNILARVNGGNPSFINGLLQVTGGNSNLFLMNPAGIVFGQGASLNIPASFTATTANQIGFGNNLFNAFGDNNFSALVGYPDSFLFTTNQAGSIVNAGNLSVTPGQGISLIGGNIVNTGNINAGNITLAAVPGTNRVRISQPGHLLSLEIVLPVDSVITPLDLPRLLTGSDLPGISSNGSTVEVAGVNIPTGQGINITAGNLSTGSQGGVINVLGDRVALVNANLNASGSNGGGTIRVGGEYRGGGVNPFNSRITYVDAGSFLNADALNTGNGGRVIVWADDTTRFYGNISARGGASSGNGGFAEVSGAQVLTFAGNADLSAPQGSFGTLLLDPVNIFINNGADALGGCTLPTVAVGCSAGDITISQATLQALPAAANVVLEASNNITLGTLTGNALTFVGAPGGSITFRADQDGNGVGNFLMNAGDRIVAPGRNIAISAASITAGDIDASTISAQNGGSINLTASVGDISAGSISSGSGVGSGNAGAGGIINILAPLGNINISGNVDSRSVVNNVPADINGVPLNPPPYISGNSSNAGDITIAAQSVNMGTPSNPLTGAVAAYSRVDLGTSGNGGNIVVRATNGGITVRGINTTSGSRSGTAGNGGNIDIDIDIDAINNNITLLGATINQIDPRLVFALDSRSLSAGNGNAGNGGNIMINQNPPTNNGIFRATGEINSSSAVENNSITATGDSGSGGVITITAQSINTNDIISYSHANRGNSRDGGSLNISSQGNLSTGDIRTYSYINDTRSFSAGNGGSLNISSQGNLSTGYINSSSTLSGIGGSLNISSQGNLSTNSIISDGDRNGGSINISSQGNLSITSAISSNSFSNGNGGSINISSQGNLSITSDTTSNSFSNGNGGSINISSQGNLSTDRIYSESVGSGGYGGNITINAGNLFLLAPGIYTSFLVSRDGSRPSISTQGGLGGGSIDITHGGSTNVPFLVGNATNNGTRAAITSGTGTNTINNLIVPVPPAINPYGTNITIRTTVPTPTPLPTPSISPTPLPTPSISSTAPSSSLSSGLVSLLINPTPPQTPDPIVVGTPPPILIPETTPLSSFISTPPTPPPPTVVVAPPVVPTVIIPTPQQLSLLPLPPPAPVALVLDRPILDATSPGVQSPISLATANSNIPIIDRIPVINLNDRIRLLDDPFKEEFQAFTGLADEVATLDVNQAQDILNRITRQTNVKPALIYVFFSPANDTAANNRSVSSARSQLFRNPSNTDTLEIVLVPPTGDLVRVRYNALTRPEVLESAGELTRGVARRSVYGRGSRRMYDLIVAPLEEDLKRLKIDNLVFLMDRGLRSMPIAAMQSKDNRFIIEDYSVALMPSLTLTDTTYSSLKDSQVMAMGADRFVVDNLPPLPGVPVELKAINQIRGGNIFLNENFTLSNLRQNRSPNQRIVHLATHGSFYGDKVNSYIQLWGTERLTLEQIRSTGFGTPPVDLLVLSACETALGNTDAELGFAGLAVTSGVRSALASLWQVSDEGTMGLMAEFYQQLQTTTTKSEALRQAQLAMLRGEVRLEGGSLVTPKGNFALNDELRKLGDRRLTHPYYWSAFTMIGNPW